MVKAVTQNRAAQFKMAGEVAASIAQSAEATLELSPRGSRTGIGPPALPLRTVNPAPEELTPEFGLSTGVPRIGVQHHADSHLRGGVEVAEGVRLLGHAKGLGEDAVSRQLNCSDSSERT
jgi:hypothetical protein